MNQLNTSSGSVTKANKRLMWGAVFLMATSSIGPAFLTQTAVFTEQFAANFAFAILASVIIDIGAQLNIWRIITVSGKRGQDVANMVLPGLGSVIAVLIVFGGLAFNIGNVAGAGLGLNVLFGISPVVGAVITGILAIIIFSLKDAGKAMDLVAQALGILMLVMVGYVMFTTHPPAGDALVKSILPDDYGVLLLPMITLVGGSVGGYITFAGGHRLVDAGVTGKENVSFVSKAANLGVLTTGVMRVFLFLAVLGVISAGYSLDPGNPPASVFQIALGDVGYKIFGIVLFSAAMTSVIGCAYTSVSFLRSFHRSVEKYNNWIIIAFIAFSTLIFAVVGKPVNILVIAGSLNGLILPLTLGSILLASRKRKIVGDYHHPTWMILFGFLAVVVTLIASWYSLQGIADLWNK
ncbi:NRAMP family divalent metal transporter [Kroppenstedtia eburnea]|uniref:Mn2+ and Fe2+ transporters of the NRAMP family n=1 Tax=Kroppenstedtia eburnea TaxID=714067 RepID=A0A1N7PVK4_9BACL|nr:NRAMP family divalent metal transporter [Kroppenstedtia eburnea]EGK09209.1 branched chain amino acid:cation symporter family transporter [Desmospora sp. 8437]QKI80937.1 divalent metal cation transporter [Kroppenstedtia eburnea]SIT14575.1 Mn2+ and Fe2+ transporters of the NRAMP family [Kroppenstedtia eburnea]